MTMKTENKIEENLAFGIAKSSKKNSNKQNVQKEKNTGKPQPRPEQLRIAQLLDNAKKEDPKLKEKLKQVMEATQKSMDDAFIALHDSDYDANRAVNLLLEGCEMEWSTLSKKKKVKSPGQTQERSKKEEAPKPEVEESHPEPTTINRPFNGNRGRNLRGRGGRHFQEGRNNNFQHDQSNFNKRRSMPANVPVENDETPSVIETRYFERAKMPVVRPVDTWDPKHPVSNLLNKSAAATGVRTEEEEEEYTGSLANGLVITSSCFGKSSQSSEGSVEDRKVNSEAPDVKPDPQVQQVSFNTKIPENEVFNTKIPENEFFNTKIPENEVFNTKILENGAFNTKIPENEVKVTEIPGPKLPSLHDDEHSSKPIIGTKAPPITASVIKGPPPIEKAPVTVKKSLTSLTSEKLPTSSEIPTSAVVMPPECESVRLLDVTFGSIDLNEKDLDSFPPVNEPVIHHPPSPPKVPEPPQVTKSDHQVSKQPSSVDSSESLGRVNGFTKPEVNSFYENSLAHNSYPKMNQKSRGLNNTTFQTESLCSPSTIMYSSNVSTGTYSSPPPMQGAVNNTIPPMHYNSYTTQGTQPHPMLQNMTGHYQNVLSGQTYTSNSQYGSSILPSSTYSVSYPSYSSMVQQSQKHPTTSSSYSRELDSANLNSMSYSSPTNPSLAPNTLPTTKPSGNIPSLGKNNAMSNIPPLPVAPHQIILGQGGMPYYQQPLYYQDLHMLQQQRLTPHMNAGYYDVNYSTTRDGSSYHLSDKMFPLVQHANHHPAAGPTNEHVNTNLVYGDSYSSHYQGMCVTGLEGNNPRADTYKSMQSQMNPPGLSGMKPVQATPKVGSYE